MALTGPVCPVCKTSSGFDEVACANATGALHRASNNASPVLDNKKITDESMRVAVCRMGMSDLLIMPTGEVSGSGLVMFELDEFHEGIRACFEHRLFRFIISLHFRRGGRVTCEEFAQ